MKSQCGVQEGDSIDELIGVIAGADSLDLKV